MKKDTNLKKQLQGYLFGSACGDALGRPVEHFSLEEIKAKYGEKGILEIPPDSPWTDDTQIMLVLARALFRGAELEPEKFMPILSEEFVKWLDEPDLGAGETCKGAATRLREGFHWSESGIKESKKCGSLMRSGIIGFVYRNDPDKLLEIASLSGKISHCHPTADAACIAGTYAVKLALDGVRPEEMFDPLLKITAGISEEFTEAFEKAYELANGDMCDEDALRKIGLGWYAEETFALACFCMLRYPDDYKKVVQTAVNITGDSDSIGAVAGGIMGARLGIEAVPGNWIRGLREKETLEGMVRPLLDKYEIVSEKAEER